MVCAELPAAWDVSGSGSNAAPPIPTGSGASPARYAAMSFTTTSAAGSRNQIRPSKMLDTKKDEGKKMVCVARAEGDGGLFGRGVGSPR